MTAKRQHCQEELEFELALSTPHDALMMIWHLGGYSTSAHLLVLYSLIHGLNAKRIGEIGVGRSSIVILDAAKNVGAKVVCCDRYDYRDLLHPLKTGRVEYLVGDASKFFDQVDTCDFMFFDYMSTIKKSEESCYKDLKRAVRMLPTNGIVAVHDAYAKKYNVAAALNRVKSKFGKAVEVLTLPYGNGLGLIRRCDKSPHGILNDTWKKKPDEKPEEVRN